MPNTLFSSLPSSRTLHPLAIRTLALLLASASGAIAEPHGELIGWNMARFYASEAAADRPRSSPSLYEQPERTGVLPEDYPFVPTWRREANQTVITVNVPASASFYGLGRAEGSLLRADSRFEGSNVSPYIMGVRDDGTAFGIILDTMWAAAFEVCEGRITVETPDPDPSLIVMNFASPAEVTTVLASLTGRMEIPPAWGLGVQMSGDAPAEIMAHIDSTWIPCELAALETTDDCLTAADNVPGEAARDADVRRIAAGTFTVSRDAARAIDDNEHELAWARNDAGEPIEVQCQLIPDFANAAMRAWWGERMASVADRGAAGIAAPFRDLLEHVPHEALLAGDAELGGLGTVAQFAGVYSLLAAQAAWEGFDPERRDRRAMFVVPTAALGAQRWTSHLIEAPSQASTPQQLIAAALNSTLTAQPLVGASLPSPADMEQNEWNQMLAAAGLLPILHLQGFPPAPDASSSDGARHAEATSLLSAVAAMRTQLFPHIYTLAFHTFYQGDLILRPLFFDHPADADLRGIDTAFLLGRDLLVAPPLGEDTFSPVGVLPETWRRFHLGEPDPRLPSLYLRAGGILPVAPVDQRAANPTLDPLTIIVSLDETGSATGVLYEDKWDDYSLFRGQTRRLTYHAMTQEDTVLVRLHGMDGGWGMPTRRLHVRVLTENGELLAQGSERGTIRIPLAPDPVSDR